MHIVSEAFKTHIAEYGRQIDAYIEMDDLDNTIYGSRDIVSIRPYYDGKLLSSVMRCCDIELDGVKDVPVDNIKNIGIGVHVGDGVYDYLNLGEYIITKKKYDDANNSTILTCYDKIVLSMVPYDLVVEYPISLHDYLEAICSHLGLILRGSKFIPSDADSFVLSDGQELFVLDEFVNSTIMIEEEKFDNTYTFRDVLDQIAQAVAGTIAMVDGKLSILYPSDSGAIYDASNMVGTDGISIGNYYGPINSVVLARTPQEDNIYRLDDSDETIVEFKIENNQIMDSHREDFIDAIYEKLKGLSFYLYDFHSYGYLYVDVCDFFTLRTIDGTEYKCLMLSDDFTMSQGIDETSSCKAPDETKTDYSAASKRDRAINKTILRVDKQDQVIESLVSRTEELGEDASSLRTRMTSIEQTAKEVSISVEEILEHGVDKVTTRTGYTFSDEGLQIEKTGEEIGNRIDNTGVYVERSGTTVFQANNEGVIATDVTIRNYLIIGNNSRMEDIVDDNYESRTGVFWIGG